ncbi:HAD-like domain-containing protein [Mycena maculata]|uniref:HAD-like domain-containing protein n=1 Tax=Mycena maculata TaxID=230809 RepID=A0AAD7NJD0_9AGAR|nr:HAD-like domain-containing protein [Mycena maculata]
MSMTAQESEDLKAFKQRLHTEIKAQLEPSVQRAKQELLQKMKQARDDKTKQQLFLQEYNEAIRALDQAGTEQFKEQVLREKIRRNLWGDDKNPSADRSQSRIGGFVEFAGQPEWNMEGLEQQRPTPSLGHNRSKSSLGNNAAFHASMTSKATYGSTSGRTPPPGARLSHPSATEDILQSAAKVIGVDEARIRKFAEEQARLERAHSPVTPMGDPAIRKFAEEQARLHRAHSPEIPRNDTHLKFAEEQARLHRAHSPEIPRNDSQSKFVEEQARLNGSHSPDTSRNDARTRATHSPTDSARLAAFAEQQLRAQNQYTQDSRSASRLGQNAQQLRGKSTSTAYTPTIGRGPGATQSLFSRFPLNEPDDVRSPYDDDSSLTRVEVLFFDLDGTVLDWQGSVAAELRRQGAKHFPTITGVDWEGFAMKWRELYLAAIRNLAEHGDSLAPSTVYHTTLDQLLSKESANHVARWTPTIRNQLVEVWERTQAWPDVKDGLKAMKTLKTVATLSNLPLRAQTQMTRHAGLSWDVCLTGSLLGSFKPNPDAYLEAARSMTLPPSNCAVVSAHLEELRMAGSAGMKTIYVRRPSEDRDVEAEVLSKLKGGEFDLVVDSFEHLAIVLGCDD